MEEVFTAEEMETLTEVKVGCDHATIVLFSHRATIQFLACVFDYIPDEIEGRIAINQSLEEKQGVIKAIELCSRYC